MASVNACGTWGENAGAPALKARLKGLTRSHGEIYILYMQKNRKRERKKSYMAVAAVL